MGLSTEDKYDSRAKSAKVTLWLFSCNTVILDLQRYVPLLKTFIDYFFMAIEIRAHHLSKIYPYIKRFQIKGLGGSQEMTEDINQVLKDITENNDTAVITNSEDVMCSRCPHLGNYDCENKNPVQKDKFYAELYGVEIGREYNSGELVDTVIRNGRGIRGLIRERIAAYKTGFKFADYGL